MLKNYEKRKNFFFIQYHSINLYSFIGTFFLKLLKGLLYGMEVSDGELTFVDCSLKSSFIGGVVV